MDIERGQLKLGPYRKSGTYRVMGTDGDDATIRLERKDVDDNVNVTYKISEVEHYVNIGLWLMKDDKGNILNDWAYLYY